MYNVRDVKYSNLKTTLAYTVKIISFFFKISEWSEGEKKQRIDCGHKED
ncbi:MAG: hypothetical protein AAB416_00470 [Patescibacteria group bacterium]